MRPLPTPAALALLCASLGSCRPAPPPPAPALVSETALLAAIDLGAEPLPELRPAALGLGGTLEAPTRADFPEGQAVALRDGNQGGLGLRDLSPGQISARGRVTLTLPAGLDLAGLTPLTPAAFVRQFNVFGPCALDTIRAEGSGAARLSRLTAVTRNPYAGRATPAGELRFVTSPPPREVPALPTTLLNTGDLREDTGLLVYANTDVRLSGELRCVFRWVTRLEDATQFNLSVNLDLRRGWNVLRNRFDATGSQGTLTIYRTTLTGGAADVLWRE